jgi:hypothetical protein
MRVAKQVGRLDATFRGQMGRLRAVNHHHVATGTVHRQFTATRPNGASNESCAPGADRVAARFHAGDVQQQTDHTRYIRSRAEDEVP